MSRFICVLVMVLYTVDFGIKQKLEAILRVTYKKSDAIQAEIETQIEANFSEFQLINRILDFGDDEETNVYVVRPKSSGDPQDIECRLRAIEGVVNLSIYQSYQHASF